MTEKTIITYNHYLNILQKLERKGMHIEKANDWIQEKFKIETSKHLKEIKNNRKLTEFF